MKHACCMKCGSVRLRRSRRRSWIEFAVAFVGWRAGRCADCNTRYLRCGAAIVQTNELRRLGQRLLLGAIAIGAMAAVLGAILYFARTQASDAAIEGILLAL